MPVRGHQSVQFQMLAEVPVAEVGGLGCKGARLFHTGELVALVLVGWCCRARDKG